MFVYEYPYKFRCIERGLERQKPKKHGRGVILVKGDGEDL